ncbi:hypothetical protein L3Q65_00605 (plasmid) [Amycolatopsis sp. FU40]|uniref:hypothetical protein n=1 Tax=Amycolatopsis sp. FU40 TaxID=2914159 RepID=UPI001F2E6527|nr:hypothetical protein [Amycolatopsis sp. FU40]UKD50829.1 hypothetical protein L3Q65_00605 [Amycolatopsis sp. FU40]
MPTVLDPAARRSIEDVRADIARTLADIDTLAADETSANAVRARLGDALGTLDILAHEAVIHAWIACTCRFWSERSVPWIALAEAFAGATGETVTSNGLDRRLTELFAGHAPRRRAVAGRRVAAGYSVTALWAAITHWHCRAGLPQPVSAWCAYPNVAAVLDLVPAIVEHSGMAANSKQLVAAVRATSGPVSRMNEQHVAELAREHVEAARHWVTVALNG